jgi:hypothetical protein
MRTLLTGGNVCEKKGVRAWGEGVKGGSLVAGLRRGAQ